MATIGTKNNGTALLGDINEIDFIDAKRMQAIFGADSLFGQGVVINSENDTIKKALTNFANENKLDELLLQAEEDAQYGGRVVITIDKAKSGKLWLSYVNNELLQNVLRFEITPFGAILMKKKVIGLQTFFITETYTETEIFRSISIRDGDTKQLRTATELEIPDDFNIPMHEVHNLGFVPFIEYTNKPSRNLQVNTGAELRLQQDYAVRYMTIHINSGLRQWYKEEILGKTRAFGKITVAQANKLKSQGNDEASILTQDGIVEVDTTPNQSKPIEISPGTFNVEPWSNGLKMKMNAYFIGCGYSALFPEVSDPTEAESLLSRDQTIKTTKAKRRRWQPLINDLFAKYLVYAGLAVSIESAKEQFSIEIKENVVYNQLQLVEFLTLAVENRFMTRTEAIMQQRDLDNQEEAEEIRDTIEKEYDEEMEKTAKMMTDANDPTSMGAMGNNGDADKVGAGG